MKNKSAYPVVVLVLLLSGMLLVSFKNATSYVKKAFPYKKEGLTERQAAAHLLSRFTYGAKPGQVDEVVKMGLENWFAQQLAANQPEDRVEQLLAGYNSLRMTNEQIARTYPKGGQLLKMAIRDGAIAKDAVKKEKENRAEYRKALQAYMLQNNYKLQNELNRELQNQKILRATYSQNQLQEVLTSFWFNHFNVSLSDNDCARFIVTYERDVIRPNALGNFETILLATAQSPAMLTYLDNFMSAAPTDASSAEQERREQRMRQQLRRQQPGLSPVQQKQVMERVQKARKEQGLNENYAREIMELHTLGVDGGYTQQDVTQAARVLTGWTIFPGLNGNTINRKEQAANSNGNSAYFARQGFVREGDFLFAANRHDKGEKVVMGTRFPAGGGYEEGVKLINMLAKHPATARFISSKLAVRFVSDNPSKSLIDKMAKTFTKTDGDIRQVLLTMVSSPEFWSKEALREKTKSPFELAISSVRSLNAEVTNPAPLAFWIAKMGEKMYAYQAPTGFPDKGQFWINTGSLLSRMNFGLALVSRRIPGVQLDLAALHQNREPESAEHALRIYSNYLLPERNLDETVQRLTPLVNDPEYSTKVNNAASKLAPDQEDQLMEEEEVMLMNRKGKERQARKKTAARQEQASNGQDMMLAQVVGIIIGSPEFQRR
ncbi:DUF1800 domain-containing protein [Botryobacter ruber]|uniref:DUF1800 domain-containing protein n=1 Tax=Botryobacter ruber TaxID=2171629 RepID=UPI000E0BC34A|nr:DUF1800 domain-containing protein [Botryobacter ruber]